MVVAGVYIRRVIWCVNTVSGCVHMVSGRLHRVSGCIHRGVGVYIGEWVCT